MGNTGLRRRNGNRWLESRKQLIAINWKFRVRAMLLAQNADVGNACWKHNNMRGVLGTRPYCLDCLLIAQ
jgi:hypothetical protein